MNIISAITNIFYSDNAETAETDEYASFEAELAFIREAVGLLDETMLNMETGEHQDGWLEDCWIDLHKLSLPGKMPVYLIYVDGLYFETITEAVLYIAQTLQF